MLNCGIDRDLVAWTKSFLTDQKIQLVIDRNDNKEKEIEIRILQRFLILHILLLLYISKVFDTITENNLAVISLSFVNDLEFIASDTLIKEISQILDIVASTVFY